MNKVTQPYNNEEKNQWLNISNEEHHALKCVSSSKIKHLAGGNSLYSYYEKYIKRSFKEKKPTDSMLFGNSAHLLLLEPEKFYRNIVIRDVNDKRTKEYKKFMKAYEDKPDVNFVTSEEMRTLDLYVLQFQKMADIMDKVIVEQSGISQHPDTGLWCSVRGDIKGPSFFIDFKTMGGSCTLQDCQKFIENWHVPIQAAHYIDTANEIEGKELYTDFWVIFLNKEPPYEVSLFKLDKDALEQGRFLRDGLLKVIAKCEEMDYWPKLDEEQVWCEKTNSLQFKKVKTLGVSPWYLKKTPIYSF